MKKYLHFNLCSLSSLVLLCGLFSNLLSAFPVSQSQPDTTSNQYFELAESLYRSGDYEISSYNYLRAAEGFKSDDSWSNYLKCLNYAGVNLRYVAKYKQAKKILRNGLITGLKKYGMQNPVIADLYNSLGSVFYEEGNLNDALLNYETSLNICKKLFGEENKNTARGYHNVGLIYYWLGDADNALGYLNKALAIWTKTIGENNANIGNCYINLANTYFLMEDFDKSIEYDLKALETWKAVLGEEHQYIAMSYNNLAQTYETLGRNDEALAFDRKALYLRKKLFGDSHPDIGYSLAHIGKDYTRKGNYDSAFCYYNKAFVIYNNYPTQLSYKLEGLLGLANLNVLSGNYDDALKNYDSILVYTLPGLLEQNVSIDSLNITSFRFGILSAVAGKGDAFYNKYSGQTKKKEDLLSAYNWFLKYDKILHNMKHRYKRETSKLIIGENLFNTESRLIEVALDLFKLTGDKGYQARAFEFAEESKAGTLLEAINESGAQKYSGIPDSLIKKENDIKKELAYLETKIQENEESGLMASDMIELLQHESEMNEDYENLIDLYEQNYPNYYKLKYSQTLADVDDIQERLLTDSTLFVEYFIADSTYYIFTIDTDGLKINSFADSNLTGNIVDFRNSLENLDFKEYINTAKKLYSLLINPFEKKLANKKLIYLVPDGILNYLPFEALLSSKTVPKNNLDFSKLHYLINDYEFCYNYSATLMLNRTIGNGLTSFVGFAPVFPDKAKDEKKINTFFNKITASNRSVKSKDKIFSSLPESEKEVNEIRKLFNSVGLDGKAFTFKAANESNLKSTDVSNYSCVHLATHGFIDDERPMLSGLLLADDSSETEDGILYTPEIFTLNLNARLVVLSACESGLGKIKPGEGILGFARGFLYAGTDNVVVSLWQVADESTSDLMIGFYKSLLDGYSISAALRKAKLKLIREKKFAYPLEWAPFVLVGNN